MKIPLTTFSTFVAGTPSAKIACVSTFKQGYDPRHDYWKGPREAIPRNHQDARPKSGLDDFLRRITSNKAANYALRIEAYKEFWGSRRLQWAGGSSRVWSSAGLDVSVNPELFLDINGKRHIIKLYFNKDKISSDRAHAMLRLMEIMFQKGPHKTLGVLDLGQGELITPGAPLDYLDPVLAGEAASFVAVYKRI
jgi:hypothetical protein